MTKNRTYQFSILRYVHAIHLGESLNVGFLVFFSDENRIHFELSDNLNRLKGAYGDSFNRVINKYLKSIESHIKKLNNSSLDVFYRQELDNSFDNFLSNYILPRDNSSLQFSESIKSLQYDLTNDSVIDQLKISYFQQASENKKIQETIIGERFYKSIKDFVREAGQANNPNFYSDYHLENRNGTKFKFKYAWQNGTLNLVRPLNFDLSDPTQLANKVYKNESLIRDFLSGKDQNNEHSFHIIFKYPRKKALFKQFDYSMELLERLNKKNEKRVKLIPELELPKYVDYVKDTITR